MITFVRRLVVCMRELYKEDTSTRLDATLEELKKSAKKEETALTKVEAARDQHAAQSREVRDVVDEMLRKMST